MADSQRKTANLFDYQTMSVGVSGKFLRADGTESTGSEWNISDYIPCNGDVFTINPIGGITPAICLYGENKDYITGQSYGTGGVETKVPVTISSSSTAYFIRFTYRASSASYPDDLSAIMINEGITAKPYEPYGWVHSLRKLTTATEAVENPLYSDGTAITAYTIKGNTTQSGTPTPSNPVEVKGVGERTENIFNGNAFFNSITSVSGNGTLTYSDNTYTLTSVDSASTYTIPSVTGNYYSMPVKPNTTYTLIFANTNGQIFLFENAVYSQSIGSTATRRTFTTRSDTTFLSMALYIRNNMPIGTVATFSNIMLLEGDVNPSSYIPYGYKIPISTLQGSAVNYLGSVQSTRQIKKFVFDGTETGWQVASTTVGVRFNIEVPYINESTANSPKSLCSHLVLGTTSVDYGTYSIAYAGQPTTRLIIKPDSSITTVTELKQWLADQYAAGTPLTLWGILDEATTGAINEPLMKIGDYADSISNAAQIPTTDGANSITVDTTVQPSEFTATWTGWHDAEVKEYDGTNWQ